MDQRALPLSKSHTYTATGSGVTAYVLDTGVRTSHADFGGREALRQRLAGIGADVSEVVDHTAIRSVYVTDPNGISLEFSVVVRDFDADPWFAERTPCQRCSSAR